MPRVPLVEPADMPEENARAVSRSGGINVLRMVANAPELLRPWMRYGRALLTATSLPTRLVELTILRVGALDACPYELSQHEPIALSAGIPAAEVAAAVAGDLRPFPPAERACLELVEALVTDGTAGEGTVAAVRDALGPRGTVELLMLAANYHGLAGVLRALDVPADEHARLSVPGRAGAGDG